MTGCIGLVTWSKDREQGRKTSHGEQHFIREVRRDYTVVCLWLQAASYSVEQADGVTFDQRSAGHF